MTVNDLPSLNASLNAVSALWLTAGYVFIRRRRVAAHRFCMVGAFVTSTAFLTAYVVYHLQVGSRHFVGPPLVHGVYLAILASHTLLAIPLTVLAVVTLRRALSSEFERHRAIARFTLPIWWYVSVTGVVVYVMLYHL